ncbi:hypothetical protein ISCGN_026817 [Ixodes scapularis]
MRRASSSASCAGGSGDVRTPSPDWLIATPYLSVVCSFATSSARNVVCVCLTFPATTPKQCARQNLRTNSYSRNEIFVSFAQVTTKSYDSSEAVLRTSYDQISMADSVAVATTHGRLFFYVRFSRVPTSSSKKKVKST